MTTKTKPAKCPWPMPHMRATVKRAIDNVGGQRAFDFMGQGMREAIIDQACWHLVMAGTQFAQPGAGPTFAEMVVTRQTAHEIAGIWEAGD